MNRELSDNMDMIIYEAKRKMLAKYPRFGSEVAKTPIVFTRDVRTGDTDGKSIHLNPEYYASVSEEVRLYLLAHETCHKKFEHMFRVEDKDGNMRDLELWNIVCDALVNANLKRDGIHIPDGRVCADTDEEYGDWVLEYNAEELYQMKKKEKEGKNPNNGQNHGGNGSPNDKKEGEKQQYSDNEDHSLWKKAFENQQQPKNKQQGDETENGEMPKQQDGDDFDEKREFENNRKEKREKFKAKREKVENGIRGNNDEKIDLSGIGESKEAIDWKILLRREVEKTETIWSQRRSIAENNYAYRLEENEVEDEAETEVMIDVSGSVNLNLVKAFLRQVKPIVKQSKLKVGCFNEKFWGFVDIKSERDIDNFRIPREARGHYAWTEDWDLAVRSFTKKREINKIVFTDGYPCPGTMPKNDLRRENVVWLVYGNRSFNPCCGKVINITERQLEKLNLCDRDTSIEL